MTNIQQIFVNKPDVSIPLEVVPVAGRIGAEIKGVTLSGDLSAGTIAAIRAALARHKVVFFRDQNDLDDAKQGSLRCFARYAGRASDGSGAGGFALHPRSAFAGWLCGLELAYRCYFCSGLS